ncbi:helix-turn-helix domain-containing protein [Pseudomaricurvus sp. HS19]|uniref:helix-turn-helix domain-containing protein n=1 Tax=Pseudomaricurvus sp. HS19 TaxID=2692626 RepID=UPI001369F8A4|nr:helix-turn-helix transcriptional regulator [Pseudomaricurvus sp. HS19]MYM64752.1 helix-turn-helix domain-containing protein [Pseudomaricurvus sp. HS19]
MTQIVTYNGIVGYILETRRNELGFDQATVARAAGLSQPVLSRLEKGSASITMDQLFLLADALKTTPSEIIKVAETNAQVFNKDNSIDLMTTKQSNSNTNALLTGAAIGAVLALLLK